jgi:hypothetical protein
MSREGVSSAVGCGCSDRTILHRGEARAIQKANAKSNRLSGPTYLRNDQNIVQERSLEISWHKIIGIRP